MMDSGHFNTQRERIPGTIATEMMGDETIKIVSLNRAQRANAIDIETAAALAREFEALPDSVKVVVLRSQGGVFSAGVDLEVLDSLSSAPDEAFIRNVVYGTFQRVITLIAHCPVPVIAELQGPALGAAADIVLACDLCVASEEAWIEETWNSFGLIPALGGAFELTRAVGRRRALKLLLSAPRLTASECQALGLIQEVVSSGAVRQAATDLALSIATNERETIVAMKAMVRHDSSSHLSAYLSAAVDQQIPLIQAAAFRDRLIAAKTRVHS